MPDPLNRERVPAGHELLTSIREGTQADILDAVTEPLVALAIWRRSAADLPALAGWLDSLPIDRLPDGRFSAPADEVPGRLVRLCDLVGLGDCRERALLIDDIAGLAGRFAMLAGCSDVDVRLEALDHDSCWRFHRDHVGLRLNATYRGPGTQFVPAGREAAALRSQRRYRGALEQLQRFDAGLFKGVRRAGARAVVHRSPPIKHTGLTRLFLCLNEVLDC